MRSIPPVNLCVYYPKTEESRQALAQRVSDIHAAAVIQRIQGLNCPQNQKLTLLDAVMEAIMEKDKHR